MMLCSRCKKQEAGAGYKQCDDCRLRARAYVQKHMREHREHYNARMREYMRVYSQVQRTVLRELEP